MALFFCRRWAKEPPKRRSATFAVREIEPFFAIELRDGASALPTIGVAIGVAIQKADGTWAVHELTDETHMGRAQAVQASPEAAGKLKARAVLVTKKRLVEALNRLGEHYERVYVYRSRSCHGDAAP